MAWEPTSISSTEMDLILDSMKLDEVDWHPTSMRGIDIDEVDFSDARSDVAREDSAPFNMGSARMYASEQPSLGSARIHATERPPMSSATMYATGRPAMGSAIMYATERPAMGSATMFATENPSKGSAEIHPVSEAPTGVTSANAAAEEATMEARRRRAHPAINWERLRCLRSLVLPLSAQAQWPSGEAYLPDVDEFIQITTQHRWYVNFDKHSDAGPGMNDPVFVRLFKLSANEQYADPMLGYVRRLWISGEGGSTSRHSLFRVSYVGMGERANADHVPSISVHPSEHQFAVLEHLARISTKMSWARKFVPVQHQPDCMGVIVVFEELARFFFKTYRLTAPMRMD